MAETYVYTSNAGTEYYAQAGRIAGEPSTETPAVFIDNQRTRRVIVRDKKKEDGYSLYKGRFEIMCVTTEAFDEFILNQAIPADTTISGRPLPDVPEDYTRTVVAKIDERLLATSLRGQ